jgi:hypothetical protein
MQRLLIVVALVFAAPPAVAEWAGGQSVSTSTGTGPSLDSPYAKIWVSKNGAVEVDGKPADLDLVESTLATLAERKGVVLYGRDGATEEPHPNAMKVIQMVVAHRLPIRMSTKPDFSDAVGPDGKLKK